MLGAQFFVAFNLDLGHDFKAGFEVHRLALGRLQIGYARLRNRDQAESLGFLTKMTRHQRINDVVLNVARKALANDGRRHVAATETGDASQFLIFLY